MILSFPKDATRMARDRLVIIDDPSELTGTTESVKDAVIVSTTGGACCSISNSSTAEITVVVSGFFSRVPENVRTDISPAEQLAGLYIDKQESALDGIDGSFTFGIIDWARHTILFGIDKMGIARAYEGIHGGVVACSNSLNELKQLMPSGLEVDLDSINEFLILGWNPAPHSMFKQVAKLLPGTLIRWQEGTRREIEYFDIRHTPDFISRSRQSLTEEIRSYLDRAVRRGVDTGGRWGSFLSGGMDSSSVVSSLSLSTDPGFPTYFGAFDPELNKYLTIPDETRLAQIVADHCHSSHEVVCLEPDAVDSMPEIVRALEEPVCDGGCLVVAQVIKSACGDADGLMTGVGGDFLFGGERRHVLVNLMNYTRHVPRPAWAAVQWMFGLLPLLRNARLSQIHFDLNRFLNLQGLDFDHMYARILEAQPVPMERLMKGNYHAQLKRTPVDRIRDYHERVTDLDPLTRILYLDLKMVTPSHCVREVETLGNYYGVRTYNPYLDTEFVDFAMTIPASVKVRGLELKSAMKKAMVGRLPDTILKRRKGGLGGPTRWWITRGYGLVNEVLSRESIEQRGLFDSSVIDELRKLTAADKQDYSKLLWSVFTLELWMRQFLD